MNYIAKSCDSVVAKILIACAIFRYFQSLALFFKLGACFFVISAVLFTFQDHGKYKTLAHLIRIIKTVEPQKFYQVFRIFQPCTETNAVWSRLKKENICPWTSEIDSNWNIICVQIFWFFRHKASANFKQFSSRGLTATSLPISLSLINMFLIDIDI